MPAAVLPLPVTTTVKTTTTPAAVAPVNTAVPSVSGAAQQGVALTGSAGSWTGTQPISFSYRWLACGAGGSNCLPISGATGSTYLLGGNDVGTTVEVSVTASNGGGTVSVRSVATGTVAAAPTPQLVVQGAPSGNVSAANLWVSPSGGSSPLRCVTACAFNPSNAFGSIDAAYAAASPGDTVVLACGSYGYTSFSSRKSSGPNVVFEPASAGCVTTEGFQFENGGDYATLRGLTINDSGGAITQSGSSFSYGVVIDGDMINVGQRVDTQDVNLHLVNGWQIVNSTIGPSCCGAGGNSPEGIRIGTPGGGNSTNVLIDNNLIQYTLRTTSYWPSGWASAPSSSCGSCHDDGIHVWGLTSSTISNNRIVGAEVQGIFFEPTNGSLNKDINIVNNQISVVGGNAGISIEATASNSTAGTWNITGNTTQNLIVIGGGFSGAMPGTVFNLSGNTGELMISDSSGDAVSCTGYPSTVAIHYSNNNWIPVGGGTPLPC